MRRWPRHEGTDLRRRSRRTHAPPDRHHAQAAADGRRQTADRLAPGKARRARRARGGGQRVVAGGAVPAGPRRWRTLGTRSEEHTSELQSLMRISYAVFCLKKKRNKNRYNNEQY